MKTSEICSIILKQLQGICDYVNEEDIEELIETIFSANKIFIGASGRSLLIMRSFAMRLMQFGFDSYVAGDTICPAIRKGDLLVLGTNSGETETLKNYVNVAKVNEAKIAVFTSNPSSSIGIQADIKIVLGKVDDKEKIQSKGSTFEQALIVLTDAVISKIYQTGKLTDKEIDEFIMERHANLQ